MGAPSDRRRSPVPTFGMVASKFMELRKRRGLMIAIALVTIGIPSASCWSACSSMPLRRRRTAAGGYDTYTALTSGVLYVFGFIMAATLVPQQDPQISPRGVPPSGRDGRSAWPCTSPDPAGWRSSCRWWRSDSPSSVPSACSPRRRSCPTTREGTGRALARRPRELGCDHADEVICNFGIRIGPSSQIGTAVNSVPCGNDPMRLAVVKQPPGEQGVQPQASQSRSEARPASSPSRTTAITPQFLYPSISLMIKTGLWIELEVLIGFVSGWAASLIGQRTVRHHDDRARGGPDAHLSRARILTWRICNGRSLVSPRHTSLPGTARTRRWRGGRRAAAECGLLPESTTVAVAVIVPGWWSGQPWGVADDDPDA